MTIFDQKENSEIDPISSTDNRRTGGQCSWQ